MGALLKPTHQEGGGFHIYGDSSKGKSTGMAVACSVFGDEIFKQSWRATSNGLEAASAMANDSLLALDEISECNPKEIGAVVYALANGSGKQRANKNGRARAVTHWRIAVLSNGERSIESAMLEGGGKS
jgi:putative DNA primase/helicase